MLRSALARAAGGRTLSEQEEMLFFRGVHIAGGARDKSARQNVLRLLRRPEPAIDRLLGAAVTETLPRIVCGTFDGDADALFALIADRSIDGFVRGALFGAAAFLARDGQLSAERMHGFLQRFYDDQLASDLEQAWIGWLEAIARLGLRDLAPLVYRAWDEGRIDTAYLERSDFEDDLAEAEKKPDNLVRFRRAGLGYIEDVLEALEWTDGPDDDVDDLPQPLSMPPEIPAVNPWRNWAAMIRALAAAARKPRTAACATDRPPAPRG